jgi:uncharacterized membrane protein HdeD (DUF308 family)
MVLGIYLMLFPAGSLLVLAQVLSIYLIADGVIRLLVAILRERSQDRGLNILTGILGILIGGVIFGAPVAGLTITTSLVILILYAIGLFAVAAGIVALFVTFTQRAKDKRLQFLAGGVVGIIFGLAILGAPTLGFSELLVRSIGALALLSGATMAWEGLESRRTQA